MGDMLVFRASKSGDAYVFFQEAMDNERVPIGIRANAAQNLIAYQRAKITDPPLENPVPLVPTKCAADAEFNIEQINLYEAKGRIGSGQAASLRQGQKDWLELRKRHRSGEGRLRLRKIPA
jgi:hypothetical protein